MTDRILLTLGVLLYAVAVPWLEINDSHVFNPHWVAHARLHEVWQLTTNTALGLFALWLIWGRRQTLLPALIATLITGGFLFAFSIQDVYGGSMVHPNGEERQILGVNIGVLGFGFVLLTSVFTLLRSWQCPAGTATRAIR